MTRGTLSRRALTLAGLGTIVGTKLTRAQPATPASPVPADEALYRIDLPASSLPAAPVAIGVVSVTMSPGTTVAYPEGASGQSVAIDHVLTGGYDVSSAGELIYFDPDNKATDVDADTPTTVASGETIVILHNEAAQQITAGDEETSTLTVGIFSLEQGSNESTVEGDLKQAVLGGSILQSVPDSGLTVTVVGVAQAGELTDAVAQFPITLESGEEWVVVFLPLSE